MFIDLILSHDEYDLISSYRLTEAGKIESLNRLLPFSEVRLSKRHFHWIALRGNLQKTMVFTIKYGEVPVNFPLNQSNDTWKV
jgi:hypothetical protein